MVKPNTRQASNVPVKTQRFLKFCFKGFVAFDTFRFYHPILFSLLASILIMVLVFVLSSLTALDTLANPAWWPVSSATLSMSNALRGIISLLLGILLTQPIARALLPMLTILPMAIATKNLGLMYVSTNYNECHRFFLKACSEHDSREKVRVICISGRYLFRELRLPGDDGISLPLHDLASKGQLEVVMPQSDPQNPTIKERYKTYSNDFLIANGVQTMDRFINFEIEAGKDFLLSHNNEVYEHNILCMWRVIIFSEHCLVQNYFPNVSKAESFRAPMFMYSRRVDGSEPNSYYDMYVTMFDLIKNSSKKRTRASEITLALSGTPETS